MKKRTVLMALILLLSMTLTACGSVSDVVGSVKNNVEDMFNQELEYTLAGEPYGYYEGFYEGFYEYIGNDWENYYYVSGRGYNRSSDIVIPSEYRGVPVIGIAFHAFAGEDDIETVTISNPIYTIGEEAFLGCHSLRKIHIPESVSKIGRRAFYGCNSLESIDIPESVTTIGDDAFKDCHKIRQLYGGITYVDGWVVDCVDNMNSFTLREDFAGIAERAIGDGRHVTLTVPEGVTSIGDYAFYGCERATINIPNSVTSIGAYAFADSDMHNITLPNSVTNIGVGAFANSNISNITIPEGVTCIEQYAFTNCSQLYNITIPQNVTTIGMGAFYGCKSLTHVTFEDISTWYRIEHLPSSTYENEYKSLETDVTNTQTNASFFKDVSTYSWYKE